MQEEIASNPNHASRFLNNIYTANGPKSIQQHMYNLCFASQVFFAIFVGKPDFKHFAYPKCWSAYVVVAGPCGKSQQ